MYRYMHYKQKTQNVKPPFVTTEQHILHDILSIHPIHIFLHLGENDMHNYDSTNLPQLTAAKYYLPSALYYGSSIN
jgi:hypothetical protein